MLSENEMTGAIEVKEDYPEGLDKLYEEQTKERPITEDDLQLLSILKDQ